MNIKKAVISSLFLTAGLTSFGWGQKGHDVTAFIAENHLTATSQNAINELLDGKSIVYWANWLDNASHTPEYAYSKTWHYKNIDDGVDFDAAPLLDTGDVVRAVYDQVNILQNPTSTKEEKQLALKILVHIMGDLHQPMHLGHASDLGGNRWTVRYFDSNTNLHTVWDSNVPEAAHNWTYTEWQNQIDRAKPQETFVILTEGQPEKWGKETFEICKSVYEKTPENYNISYDYIAEWTPVIEEQFLKGGLRLADILNTIFDPQYQASNIFIKK